MDDLAMLDAAVGGDGSAWREVVARYGLLVYPIPRRYGLDGHEAEDVFQDVFCIFLRHLPGIRRRSGLPKWFITTTHRVCRRYTAAKRSWLSVPPQRDDQSLPSELVGRWERQHLVGLALDRLGGRGQELLTALYSDQGPSRYAVVARTLDIPEGSIGPMRARCLGRLSRLLEAMES